MSLVKEERERAQACVVAERNRAGWTPIVSGARIWFTLYRRRLTDPFNTIASLKHYQDGLALALLPHGDGPSTPYIWMPPTQERITEKYQEGVLITVELMD